MKAKDYYDKYRSKVYEVKDGLVYKLTNGRQVSILPTKEAMIQLSNEILMDFIKDFSETSKQRKISRAIAVKGLIEELNNKWNAFCGLFEREYGESPFVRNGFRDNLFRIDPMFKLLYEKRAMHEPDTQMEGE